MVVPGYFLQATRTWSDDGCVLMIDVLDVIQCQLCIKVLMMVLVVVEVMDS